MESYERVEVRGRNELRRWLKKHHTQQQGIWLVTFKKKYDHYLPYDQIVEEALWFGWIDSIQKRVDDQRSRFLLKPRRPNSVWCASNKRRVDKLILEKRMTRAGLDKIEQAKQDGSWIFLDDVEAMVIPEDLGDEIKKSAAAKRNFEAFSSSAKKCILQWIKTAKKPETRRSRIRKTVEKARENLKPI